MLSPAGTLAKGLGVLPRIVRFAEFDAGAALWVGWMVEQRKRQGKRFFRDVCVNRDARQGVTNCRRVVERRWSVITNRGLAGWFLAWWSSGKRECEVMLRCEKSAGWRCEGG